MAPRLMPALAVVGVLLAACADDDGVADAQSAGGGAGGGAVGGSSGSGGNVDAGGGFGGGFGGGAGVGAQGGASGAGVGGTPSGGASGDAAAEAPFVCDGTGAVDCSAATPVTYGCGDPAPNLSGKVKNAIVAVLAQNPSWFDYGTGAACCPKALQPQQFMDAVVAGINASGACAKIDPNNPNIEIVVKLNNKCSEQYSILTSAQVVRNPPKHQGSCVPAWL